MQSPCSSLWATHSSMTHHTSLELEASWHSLARVLSEHQAPVAEAVFLRAVPILGGHGASDRIQVSQPVLRPLCSSPRGPVPRTRAGQGDLGTPREAGRAAGAATRRPATTVVRAGGELPPSCPERLKSLRLYSAKTDSHPLPDPPVWGPQPPAALPCACVRFCRPRSGAAPRFGMSLWG